MQIRLLEKLGLIKDVYAYDLSDEDIYSRELKKAA
jgi:hypothetical protein